MENKKNMLEERTNIEMMVHIQCNVDTEWIKEKNYDTFSAKDAEKKLEKKMKNKRE